MKHKKLITIISSIVIGISGASFLSSTISSNPVVSSRGLKRAYIPKRFRGNWYWNGHKLRVTANNINGYAIERNHDKAYYGTWRNVNKSTRHKLLIHPHGRKLDLILNNSGGTVTFQITKRHDHKCLIMTMGPSRIPYYRSRKVSKHHRNH